MIEMIKKDEIKITISDEKDEKDYYVKLEINEIDKALEKNIMDKFKNIYNKIYNEITVEIKETKLVKLFKKIIIIGTIQ